MDFKNGVTNLQAAGYNGALTVLILVNFQLISVECNENKFDLKI